MLKVKAKIELLHAGRVVAAGDVLELHKADAESLIAAGFAEIVKAKSAKKKTTKKTESEG